MTSEVFHLNSAPEANSKRAALHTRALLLAVLLIGGAASVFGAAPGRVVAWAGLRAGL